MKTIYRSVKNPKRYAFFVILSGVIIGGICIYGLIVDDQRRIFDYIRLSYIILGYFFIFRQHLLYKTIIDDEQRTLSLDLMTLFSGQNLDIDQITILEVHKKKNGKIKKVLIRTTPSIFYDARPYDGQNFIDHLIRLNPNIQLVDRKAHLF